MEQFAFYLEFVKQLEFLCLVKEQVHVIMDKNAWIDLLVLVIQHNHYVYSINNNMYLNYQLLPI